MTLIQQCNIVTYVLRMNLMYSISVSLNYSLLLHNSIHWPLIYMDHYWKQLGVANMWLFLIFYNSKRSREILTRRIKSPQQLSNIVFDRIFHYGNQNFVLSDNRPQSVSQASERCAFSHGLRSLQRPTITYKREVKSSVITVYESRDGFIVFQSIITTGKHIIKRWSLHKIPRRIEQKHHPP